jgi:hypothetical protein
MGDFLVFRLYAVESGFWLRDTETMADSTNARTGGLRQIINRLMIQRIRRALKYIAKDGGNPNIAFDSKYYI